MEQESEVRDGPKHLEPPKCRSQMQGEPGLLHLPSASITHPVEIFVFTFLLL